VREASAGLGGLRPGPARDIFRAAVRDPDLRRAGVWNPTGQGDQAVRERDWWTAWRLFYLSVVGPGPRCDAPPDRRGLRQVLTAVAEERFRPVSASREGRTSEQGAEPSPGATEWTTGNSATACSGRARSGDESAFRHRLPRGVQPIAARISCAVLIGDEGGTTIASEDLARTSSVDLRGFRGDGQGVSAVGRRTIARAPGPPGPPAQSRRPPPRTTALDERGSKNRRRRRRASESLALEEISSTPAGAGSLSSRRFAGRSRAEAGTPCGWWLGLQRSDGRRKVSGKSGRARIPHRIPPRSETPCRSASQRPPRRNDV